MAQANSINRFNGLEDSLDIWSLKVQEKPLKRSIASLGAGKPQAQAWGE